jgi:hypothetical protein
VTLHCILILILANNNYALGGKLSKLLKVKHIRSYIPRKIGLFYAEYGMQLFLLGVLSPILGLLRIIIFCYMEFRKTTIRVAK